jgi:hypothetical protein
MSLIPVEFQVYDQASGTMKTATVNVVSGGIAEPAQLYIYIAGGGTGAALYPGASLYPAGSLYPEGVT